MYSKKIKKYTKKGHKAIKPFDLEFKYRTFSNIYAGQFQYFGGISSRKWNLHNTPKLKLLKEGTNKIYHTCTFYTLPMNILKSMVGYKPDSDTYSGPWNFLKK
jgi:hypothetical protein